MRQGHCWYGFSVHGSTSQSGYGNFCMWRRDSVNIGRCSQPRQDTMAFSLYMHTTATTMMQKSKQVVQGPEQHTDVHDLATNIVSVEGKGMTWDR